MAAARRWGELDPFRGAVLEAYLLPRLSWDDVWLLQQRLAYEISGDRRRAALLLCEHPPVITMGRQASRSHLRFDALLEDDDQFDRWAELRRVPVRWTNRGGGCWLHLPGQLAAYPVLSLHSEGFGPGAHRELLYGALQAAMAEAKVTAARDQHADGLWVGGRQIAGVGFAVKNWVAYHGCWWNVSPPLDWFDGVQANPARRARATSMFRELRLPTRLAQARESFLRHFAAALGAADVCLCQPPPLLFEPLRGRNVRTGTARG